ncbi:DUF485 domain-containing protein [Actinoallomurus sp. NPDC052274]|uniref:DUF485 domain-containing protein n=1 Tax=Actinoallomurus sp. NPDC052274 TaxID=3155420 RepID=UPI00342B1A3A
MVTGSRPSPRHGTDPRDRARLVAIRQDERFALLKGKFRRLAVLVLSTFLGWYFLYVLASVFARDVMAYRVIGNVNVALVCGLLQFASTFVLAWRYSRYARAVLDPLAAQIAADADERVGEAVRRRAAGSSGPSYGAGPGGERPFLGATPPDGAPSWPGATPQDGAASWRGATSPGGVASSLGATPPDGMAPFLGPTPPDGMTPPADPGTPPSWRGPATRPWTGGTR